MDTATAGGEVVSTGSSNSGLISGNNGSVGVANQVGVQVEGSSVSMGNHGAGSNNGGSGGNNRGSHDRGSVDTATSGSEVISTGSSNSGLISGDNGSVGVADQVGVQVEGSSVSV